MRKARISPDDISYVECHATGTQVGDVVECRALGEAYGLSPDSHNCHQKFNQRTQPLLVGSIKGNIGHTEACSGLFGVWKLVKAFRKKTLPPSCPNYTWATRNKKIQMLQNEEIAKVLSSPIEIRSLTGGESNCIAAVSAFSFGGSNAHVILSHSDFYESSSEVDVTVQALASEKERREIWKNINPLFGRSDVCVRIVERKLTNARFRCCDLLRPPSLGTRISDLNCLKDYDTNTNNSFNCAKAFSIEGGETEQVFTKVQMSKITRKPKLALVFSGNGGREITSEQLSDLCESSQIWRETWNKCCAHVKTAHELDLGATTITGTSAEKKSVTLCAVQICQVNLLKEMEVECDFYIGHSAGETSMGFADGVLTLEEALSVAYLRAKYAKFATKRFSEPESKLGMVVISADNVIHDIEIQNLLVTYDSNCPNVISHASDFDVACINSSDCVTLSGKLSSILKFVDNLNYSPAGNRGKMKIKPLDTQNVVYHCSVLNSVLNELRFSIQKVIPNPKRTSKKWLSTSRKDSGTPYLIDADYHCDNWRFRVEFLHACERIPADALVIELGVSNLLEPCVRKTCPNLRGYLSFF